MLFGHLQYLKHDNLVWRKWVLLRSTMNLNYIFLYFFFLFLAFSYLNRVSVFRQSPPVFLYINMKTQSILKRFSQFYCYNKLNDLTKLTLWDRNGHHSPLNILPHAITILTWEFNVDARTWAITTSGLHDERACGKQKEWNWLSIIIGYSYLYFTFKITY